MQIKGTAIGVRIPEILLPASEVDLKKWAVVACDQYTSQPDYWQQVEEYVSDDPSTYHMIFPEVYLEKENAKERIECINQNMNTYLERGILKKQQAGFIYVERAISGGRVRKGLILSVDLEKYDYHKGSQTLIRATEGTVLDRLPPRIRIREKAPVEIPHIMLLIDDPQKTVIEPLAHKTSCFEKVYDFDLMMSGGHIKGYKIASGDIINDILSALEKLADAQAFQAKYGTDDQKGILLFAVGDGNHSLATAKACWEKIKKELSPDQFDIHPARYALVEVVNVHDDALVFEPIHRVVFGVNTMNMLNAMCIYFKNIGCDTDYKIFDTREAMLKEVRSIQQTPAKHIIPFSSKEMHGYVVVSTPKHQLEVGTLQSFLDTYIEKNINIKIDYIHGDDVVEQLGTKEGNIGFYLPSMNKHDLFKTVILDGVLPRKTFSMGEAEEKRYYLECKQIR